MSKKTIPIITVLILILSTIATSCSRETNITTVTEEPPSLLSIIGGGEPKQVLDADEIAGLKIDYMDNIPVEVILNNEPGYEKYYNQMMEQIIALSREFEQFELYGEEGCYLSTVLLRYFDATRNTLGNVTYALLFSEDFEKRAAVAFYLYNDEITISIENSYLSPKVAEIMQKDPDERFIFLHNGTDFDSLIASDNSLYLWSQVEKDKVTVEGDYFHALDYERLAVAYSKLTDTENLIRIDFRK